MRPHLLLIAPVAVSLALIGCGGSDTTDRPVVTAPAGAAVDISTVPLSTTPTTTVASSGPAPTGATGEQPEVPRPPDTPEARATQTVPARTIIAPVISVPEQLQIAPRTAGPIDGDIIVTWTRTTREGQAVPARHAFTNLQLERTGDTWQVSSKGAPVLALGKGLNPTAQSRAWRFTAPAARILNGARPGGPPFDEGTIALSLP